MRQRWSLAAALLVVFGLISASGVASAAPRRKAKPAHPAKPVSAPAPAPPPVASTSSEPAENQPMVTPEPESAAVTPAETPPPESSHDAASDADYAALGRAETARLAAGRTEVAVLASIDLGSRHFSYSDAVGRALAPYRLSVVPMASFGLEAYPAASSGLPVLRDLGLRGRISQAFVLGSETSQGVELDTSWTRFGGELRQRIFVPVSRPFEVGIFAGADASYFGMSTRTKISAVLPSARAISARFGVDARVLVVWRLSALLSAAYLATTSPGAVYKRFRDPRVQAFDGEIGGALALSTGVEARLTARYTRYFATFKPAVGDPLVAGGALDEQLQFGLGVRYAH